MLLSGRQAGAAELIAGQSSLSRLFPDRAPRSLSLPLPRSSTVAPWGLGQRAHPDPVVGDNGEMPGPIGPAIQGVENPRVIAISAASSQPEEDHPARSAQMRPEGQLTEVLVVCDHNPLVRLSAGHYHPHPSPSALIP